MHSLAFTFQTNLKRESTPFTLSFVPGIGKELALQLAKLNCRLILTSTNQTKLDEVKQACLERSKYGIQPEEILALACDIRVQDQCDAAFSRVVGRKTRLLSAF